MEDRNIVSDRNFDEQGIVDAFGGVILLQLRSKPPRLTAYDGVYLGIVVRTAPEDGHPDGGLLQVRSPPTYGGPHYKGRELAEPMAPAQRAAAADPLDSVPDL